MHTHLHIALTYAFFIPITHNNRYRSSVRDRSSLGLPESSSPYGFTPPHSGRSSPFNDTSNAGMGHRYADDLEGQNDEALEGLSAKVKLLKDVSEFSVATAVAARPTGRL